MFQINLPLICVHSIDGCFLRNELLDVSGNGTVSRGEWVTTFQSQFGGTADQANTIFTKLDKDKSGDISLAEVTQLFADMDADGKLQ